MSNESDRDVGGGLPAGGFTLVELMVAMVLVAVFAGLAVPSLSSTMERAEARQTARALANTFRTARNEAMSRGEIIVAEVVTAGGNSQVSGTQSEQGHIQLLRSNNNVTNCSAAGGYNAVGTPTIVEEESSNLRLHGMTGTSSQKLICFTPDGRALSGDGSVINADSDGCQLENFRMWIADRQAGGGAGSALKDAIPCDGNTVARTETNFWVVEIPYNGAIKAKR